MSMIEAALDYAARGWAVFPLEERDKKPATKHGFHDATMDTQVIRGVWGDYPNCNIGIATGKMSGGLLVIDLDVDDDAGKDGMEWLHDWEQENGKLPETACVTTGRGGAHLYYRVDRAIHISSSPSTGVDIRCDGGYVMAPPSIHPNGNAVEWDLHPDDVPVADADELVYRLVEELQADSVSDEGIEYESKDEVHEGERDNEMYRFCCSMRARNTPKNVCMAAAREYNDGSFRPPLADKDIRRIVNSAYKRPAGKSEEFKAREAAKAKERKSGAGSRGGFSHVEVGEHLVRKCGACLVDGVPAIIVDGRYETGWSAFDAPIYDAHYGANSNNIRETVRWIAAKAPKVSQADASLIAFANGVLDITTMAFRERRRSDIILNTIPHDWDEGAALGLADEFIASVGCDDVETQMNICETIGMCLSRDNSRTPMFPVLLGTGSNGKSTFINMLRWLIGPANVTAIEPHELGRNGFQKAMLAGKLADLGDDIPGGYLDDAACSIIKKVATGDIMHTDVKNGIGFDFVPYCTMVLSANAFPRLADTTDGMMRRLHPIEFNARFTQGGTADASMGERLRDEAVASRMLLLGVEALRRIIATGGMTPSTASRRIKSAIVEENSTVMQWVNDCGGVKEALVGRTKESAYEGYSDWCHRNGVRHPVSADTMSKEAGTWWNAKLTGQLPRSERIEGKSHRYYKIQS